MCKGKYYNFPCDHCQEEWAYCLDAKHLSADSGIVVKASSTASASSAAAAASSFSSSGSQSSILAAAGPAINSGSSSTPAAAANSSRNNMSVYIGESTQTIFEKGSRMLPCKNATVEVIKNHETIQCEEPECRVMSYHERWDCCACGHPQNSGLNCAARILRETPCNHRVCEDCRLVPMPPVPVFDSQANNWT